MALWTDVDERASAAGANAGRAGSFAIRPYDADGSASPYVSAGSVESMLAYAAQYRLILVIGALPTWPTDRWATSERRIGTVLIIVLKLLR